MNQVQKYNTKKKNSKGANKINQIQKETTKNWNKKKKYRVMIMRELIANVGSYCKCGYDNVAYIMSYF